MSLKKEYEDEKFFANASSKKYIEQLETENAALKAENNILHKADDERRLLLSMQSEKPVKGAIGRCIKLAFEVWNDEMAKKARAEYASLTARLNEAEAVVQILAKIIDTDYPKDYFADNICPYCEKEYGVSCIDNAKTPCKEMIVAWALEQARKVGT